MELVKQVKPAVKEAKAVGVVVPSGGYAQVIAGLVARVDLRAAGIQLLLGAFECHHTFASCICFSNRLRARWNQMPSKMAAISQPTG